MFLFMLYEAGQLSSKVCGGSLCPQPKIILASSMQVSKSVIYLKKRKILNEIKLIICFKYI